MHLTPLDTYAGLLIRTWTRYSEPGPSHPHVNPLFRAWAISSARGPAIPSLGNIAHMRNSGLTCRTGGLRAEQGAQPYTRPATSHANPLFRTRASSSARGPAIPSPGNPAHMRNSGLTCGTEGLRAEQGAQPYTRPATSHANPLFRTRAISSAREPAIPSLGHLIRTWTRYSEPGQHRPHAEQRVNMQNRGFTCGTGGTAVHQTRYFTREPAIPNPGHLIRT